jgi:hypothetical protein
MKRKQEKKLEGSREKKEEREGKLERRKKKKPKLPTHRLVSSLAAPKMEMMMCPIECIVRRTRKERARRTMTTNMPPYPLTIILCL